MSTPDRIAQFENMAQADPNNELGHFSLGKAYLEAKRFDDAEKSLRRVLELNPTYSRAYQHLGEALVGSDNKEDAIAILRQGFEVADTNGDLMPRNAMGDLLKELGQTPPEAKTPAPVASAGPGAEGFSCGRCHESKAQLPERPFKGPVGEQIKDTICADCWQEWIGMGTKVINELSLDLSSPHGSQLYDQHMCEFLELTPIES